MDKSGPKIYRKTFVSRYELSREHQILEYLGQRHAPVPPVVLSHVEMTYLEMHHGGKDLQEWFNSGSLTRQDILQAMAGALSALFVTAQLDVWHVDIALRNFVFQHIGPASGNRVWLIDFGNAICPHFALQKPLWMLPNNDQHPLLQTALTQDWQNFYKRHQLTEPTDWFTTFDVPRNIHQNDWIHGLLVEDLHLKWCVTAHGAGQMLLRASRKHPKLGAEWENLFSALLNLNDDKEARALLQQCLNRLQNASNTQDQIENHKTPRPRERAPMPESVKVPSVGRSEQTITKPEVPELITTQATGNHEWILGVPVFFLGSGWWVLDIGYSVQRQPISWLTQGTLLFILLISAIGMAGFLQQKNKIQWLVRVLWLHGIGQFILVFELWIFGMSLSSLIWLCLGPTLALAVLAFQ